MNQGKQEFQQALVDFINRNLDRLVKHASFRIGRVEDAEDVVQDVLLKMISSREMKIEVKNLQAYAYRMITNACIDLQRKQGKWEITPIEVLPEDGSRIAGTRESEMIRQEEFSRINLLLQSIPFEQSEVLRFRFVDNLTFQEIADILEVPLTTVKSRFIYGLTKVKNQFFAQTEPIHEV
jgi:RNA polymerase sigma-70 factor (ECF subfamily)